MWHLRSPQALLLDRVGVSWASYLSGAQVVFLFFLIAEAMLCREFENSFSHIFKISSSVKRENTVWKLKSDGGPESGGSKSAPILSW